MAARWKCVKVELVSGRGEAFEPAPGRIFAIPPRTTFDGLLDAINVAFGRWDHSHLSQFELADGTLVVDDEYADELASSAGAVVPRTLPLTTPVARHLTAGAQFTYVFDLGDDWTHRCTVLPPVDPWEVLGELADSPTPIFGWGNLPDQYGRLTESDDDEPEPTDAHLTLVDPPDDDALPSDPPTNRAAPWVDAPWVDLRAVRAASTTADLIDGLTGVRIDHALQQIGDTLLRTLAERPRDRADLAAVTASVINRLSQRDLPGDDLLHAQLLAVLRGDPVEPDPIDYAMLADIAAGSEGALVDLQSGGVLPDFPDGLDLDDTDEFDNAVSYRDDSGSQFGDMEAFVDAQSGPAARERLADALDGPRPFARFKNAVAQLDLWPQWAAVRDDRRLGRARAFVHEERARG